MRNSTMESLWDEAKDPKSRRTYYYNRQTKETTWTPPEEAAWSPKNQLPVQESFFIEATDPTTGRTYYYNPQTCEVSWSPPDDSTNNNFSIEHITLLKINTERKKDLERTEERSTALSDVKDIKLQEITDKQELKSSNTTPDQRTVADQKAPALSKDWISTRNIEGGNISMDETEVFKKQIADDLKKSPPSSSIPVDDRKTTPPTLSTPIDDRKKIQSTWSAPANKPDDKQDQTALKPKPKPMDSSKRLSFLWFEAPSILRWENRLHSGVIVIAGVIWFLLTEWLGYSNVTLFSLLLILHVVYCILHLIIAPTMHDHHVRSSLPRVSDKDASKWGAEAGKAFNRIMDWYAQIICGNDLRVSAQFVGLLALVYIITSIVSPMTLVAIAFVLAFSLPKAYEQFQEKIEEMADMVIAKFNETVLPTIRKVLDRVPITGAAAREQLLRSSRPPVRPAYSAQVHRLT